MPPVITDEELAILLGDAPAQPSAPVVPCDEIPDGSGNAGREKLVPQPPEVPPDGLVGRLRPFLAMFIASLATGGCKHPFAEVIEHEGERYVAVAAYSGPSMAYPGSSVTILCTVEPARSIRDAGPDVVVHRDGAPVYVGVRSDDGRTSEVWLLHHREGREVRFWVSRGKNGKRVDDPRGAARVRMIGQAPWVRRVK